MTRSGIAPQNILATLREVNKELLTSPRDIYNPQARIREEELMGRSSLKAFLDTFVRKDVWAQLDENSRVVNLLFSLPDSVLNQQIQ